MKKRVIVFYIGFREGVALAVTILTDKSDEVHF